MQTPAPKSLILSSLLKLNYAYIVYTSSKKRKIPAHRLYRLVLLGFQIFSIKRIIKATFFEVLAPASGSRFESLTWALTALCVAKCWPCTRDRSVSGQSHF